MNYDRQSELCTCSLNPIARALGFLFKPQQADGAEDRNRKSHLQQAPSDQVHQNGRHFRSNKKKRYLCKSDMSVIQVVGRGTWGTVVACSIKGMGETLEDSLQLSGQSIQDLYAVKIMKKQDLIEDNMMKSAIIERQVLQALNHPLLVKLHFAFQDETKLFMGMDYVPGGDLFFHLKRFGAFNERDSKFYAIEIAYALQHLHDLGIVYRDMKPENVILDADGHIKIVDFGLAKLGVVDPFEGTDSTCGTSYYMAPEVINGQCYGQAVDWWGLGVLLFELLTGNPPWYARDQTQKVLFFKVTKTALTCPPFVTGPCRDFLTKLLEKDPARRLQAGAVFAHPWAGGLTLAQLRDGKLRPPVVPCPNYAGQTAAKFARGVAAVGEREDAGDVRVRLLPGEPAPGRDANHALTGRCCGQLGGGGGGGGLQGGGGARGLTGRPGSRAGWAESWACRR